MSSVLNPPSGHVFRVDRKRGPVWFCKYRLPDGRQVQKRIGPAWTERGRPAAGNFTKRGAEEWLRVRLDEARRGTLAEVVRTGATFADAAAEWLRYLEFDRRRKPSTLRGYRYIVDVQVLPTFGSLPLESITPAMIAAWQSRMTQAPATKLKALVLMHGVFQRARKVWGLTVNPACGVNESDRGRVGRARRRLGRVIALHSGASVRCDHCRLLLRHGQEQQARSVSIEHSSSIIGPVTACLSPVPSRSYRWHLSAAGASNPRTSYQTSLIAGLLS